MPGIRTAIDRLRQQRISPLRGWWQRRAPAASQKLTYRRLFILPTRTGLFFLFTAALIFLLSVNYVLNLGLALAFFMFSLFMAAILLTFRNLYGLRLSSTSNRQEVVFPGRPMTFPVTLDADGIEARAIAVQFRGGQSRMLANPGRGRDSIGLTFMAEHRGRVKAPRVRVESDYPTGLCRVWADVDLDMVCVVAPLPVRPARLRPVQAPRHHGSGQQRYSGDTQGTQYFHGLRDYRSGDSLSRVAWKSLAGQRELQVKQFTDETGSRTMLRWSDHTGVEPETRLSWLCYRLLEADGRGEQYGLELPGQRFPPGQGTQHRQQLLEALALYGEGAA